MRCRNESFEAGSNFEPFSFLSITPIRPNSLAIKNVCRYQLLLLRCARYVSSSPARPLRPSISKFYLHLSFPLTSSFENTIRWAVSIAPRFFGAALTKSSNDLPEFDNVSPRDFLRKVQNQEKQSPAVQRYLRAEAAQQNGFESWGPFASAIVAGNLARLPVRYMNLFAAGYLLSRILYNVSMLFSLVL
jgi:uncharacterized MAPEG superfamily protein